MTWDVTVLVQENYSRQKKQTLTCQTVFTPGNYESIEDLKTAFNAGAEINLDDLNSFNRLKTIGVPEYVSFRLNQEKGMDNLKVLLQAEKIQNLVFRKRILLKPIKKQKVLE